MKSSNCLEELIFFYPRHKKWDSSNWECMYLRRPTYLYNYEVMFLVVSRQQYFVGDVGRLYSSHFLWRTRRLIWWNSQLKNLNVLRRRIKILTAHALTDDDDVQSWPTVIGVVGHELPQASFSKTDIEPCCRLIAWVPPSTQTSKCHARVNFCWQNLHFYHQLSLKLCVSFSC